MSPDLASGRGEAVVRPVRLPWQALALALLALAAAALAGLVLGPAALPPGDVLRELLGALPFVNIESTLDARQTAILWELRAPRVALGGLVGATSPPPEPPTRAFSATRWRTLTYSVSPPVPVWAPPSPS